MTENFPPIPQDLQVTVSCVSNQHQQLNQLQFVDMTGTSQVKNGDWEKARYLGFVSAQKSQPNLGQIGLYTMGIATCVGIGVLFQGQTHNGVGLIHLSPDVVLNENDCNCPNALEKILAKLLEKGSTIGSSIKVVQVYDIGDASQMKLMSEQVDKVLNKLKYTKTRTIAVQTDQFAPSAQMAGNASLQLGPYNCMAAYEE
ncbi:MAG: hypothetical protein PSN36_02660 [Gammaproteobacteria bacterium]|nr:hypothetical protein [Gammaproteobacteria bacterium]